MLGVNKQSRQLLRLARAIAQAHMAVSGPETLEWNDALGDHVTRAGIDHNESDERHVGKHHLKVER